MARYEVMEYTDGVGNIEELTVIDSRDGSWLAIFNAYKPESRERAETLCKFLNSREETTDALAGEMVQS